MDNNRWFNQGGGPAVPPMDLSNWCDNYVNAVDSGDFTQMQQIITTVASTFNLSWQQAGQLLNDQCLCPDGSNLSENPCEDPAWLNLPWGGPAGTPDYNGGKFNYCDRCEQGTGSFPVTFTAGGQWVYDPVNGTDYCQCCPTTPPSPCTDPMGLTYNATVNPGQLNLSAGVSGGTAPYTYTWVNNQNPGVVISTAQDLLLAPSGNYLPDGTYTGTVTDANGCTSSVTINIIKGCTDPSAPNYNPAANVDDGSCMFTPLPIPGCTDPNALNYNQGANYDDGSCIYNTVAGCTDPTAQNYNPAATVDDGSCIATVYGCTDPNALNYYPGAQVDDGSCCFVAGCTDPSQSNYNPQACIEDGSCIPYTYGCTTPGAINYNPSVNFDDGSCIFPNQIGCTDPSATNYNPNAIIDDGSCSYGAQGGYSSFNGFTNI